MTETSAPKAEKPAGSLEWFAPLLFVTVLSTVAQWRYSAFGFNPTDDGFVLAYARRILDGQIPHRDFIAIHLAGSGYLHAPFVALGGDHTYLISRFFVWVQLAFIAWAWTAIGNRLLEVRPPLVVKVCIALTAFTMSAHYFPVMAWHTIDGLFLVTAALWIRIANAGRARFLGDVLLGAAILCKQNFVFCGPLIILLFERRQRRLAGLAALALPAAYALVVIVSGGAGDAWVQLSTQSDLATPGFLKYLWEPAFAGGTVIGLLTVMLLKPSAPGEKPAIDDGLTRLVGLAIVALLLAKASYAMAQGRYLGAPAFGLFGMACGATLALASIRTGTSSRWQFGLVIVAVVWCTALSIGYNTPALAAGLLVVFLLVLFFPDPESSRAVKWTPAAIVMIVTVISLWKFDEARLKFVYLERPASELKWRLDGILPGGAGLLTDQNTYHVLKDLQAATVAAGGRYAIQPDFSGWWVKSDQANPLPIDWAQWIELGSPQLKSRAIRAMNAQRGELTIIVAKYETAALAKRLAPSPNSFRFPLAAYARTHYAKVGETSYFELYRQAQGGFDLPRQQTPAFLAGNAIFPPARESSNPISGEGAEK